MKVEAKDSSSASAGMETKCKISAADVPTYRLSSIAVAIDQQQTQDAGQHMVDD